jgi:IMP dehydrogenase/GMP reductase
MLRISWKKIKKLDVGLSYDDVLLVPKKSEVKSRRDPSLKTQLTTEFILETPFVSANMDTITERAMVLAMNELGGTGILHRFMSIEKRVAGASGIKVGIGPGSMCTTRLITGCGVPQLTAVALCAEVGHEKNVPIIADGGVKNSGDIVKALAAGASSVMLGSLLAGTIETPGEIKNGRKLYRGMASKSAQVSWRGGVPEGMAPEGESTFVWVKGHVRDVILELSGGVRSGMSYLNATELSHIAENGLFIRMTSGGLKESVAHGLFPSV